jgi:hypothetical protein
MLKNNAQQTGRIRTLQAQVFDAITAIHVVLPYAHRHYLLREKKFNDSRALIACAYRDWDHPLFLPPTIRPTD